MDNDVANCPGERIKAIRHGVKLTQAQFAPTIGLSLHVLSSIERDKITPSLSVLRAIELKYGYSREWILEGRESAPILGHSGTIGKHGKFTVIDGGKKEK